MIGKRLPNRILVFLATFALMFTATAQQIFNVKSFGAAGDGSTSDTTEINNAIKAANAAGGGLVTFPPGNYRSASIHLMNNVTLYLSNNAAILAASSGYDAAESNPFDNYQDFGHSHFHNALIWGDKLHDVGITGPGTINGDNNLTTGDPSSGQGDKAISLRLCDRVTLQDITIRQGGHFGIIANGCSNMVVSNVKDLNSTDRDGFNLINCAHVLIENSRIEGSDDSMCLKADFALGVKMLNTDIRVINCTILSTENNAIQFGSETIGDFKDVLFSGCTITGAGKAGLGVTSNDGSIIDGITFADITMANCATPIFIKLSDQNRPSSDPHPLGRIRNMSFRNITATHSIQGGVEFTSVIHGKSGTPVENITFDNVRLTSVGGHPSSDASINPPDNNDWRPRILGTLPSYGWYLRHVRGISFHNCRVEFDSNDNRPAVIVTDGQNIKLDGFTAERGSSSAYDLGFNSTTGFQVTGGVNTSGGALRINNSSSTTATITATPDFSPVGGVYSSAQSVALSSTTAGASIRYTTDGSTPSTTAGTLYSGPISISADTVVKAIAFAGSGNASAVNTAIYTFGDSGGGNNGLAFEAESVSRTTSGATAAVQTDANTSGGQWVLLSGTAVGQWVEYTLPGIPAGTYDLSMSYKALNSRGQLTLSVDGVQLGGVSDQYSAAAAYLEQTFGTVTFASTGNHVVRLTVAGKNSASSGFGLSADKFTLTPSGSLPQVAAPTFSPGGGTYSSAPSVTISSQTGGASFRYTLNGSTPTSTSGTLYSGPVTISSSATLKAIAFKSGMSDSAVTSSNYTITVPDFAISATPGSRSIPAGSNTTYTVNVGNLNAFSGTVNLSVAGLPSGASGSFNPSSVNSVGSSTLTVATATSTPAGTSTLTITGTSGSLSHSTNVSLTVTSGSTGTTVSFEAENAPVTNSGVGTSLQTDANSSNGQWISLNATGTGSWMEFTTPTINAGTYSFSMMWKGNTTRGISDFFIDGTQVGGTLDQYSATQIYPTTTVGTVTFSSSGTHKIRMHVVGKNSASSSFQLSADKFTFTAQ